MALARRRSQSHKKDVKKQTTKVSKVIKKAKVIKAPAPKAQKRAPAPAKAPRKPTVAATKAQKAKAKKDAALAKKALAAAKKIDAAPKKMSKKDVPPKSKKDGASTTKGEGPKVLKRPARADVSAADTAFKRVASAEEAPPVAVLKRPARARSADTVLKRPAKADKAMREAANTMEAQAKAFEQFNKDMDIENLVERQVRRVQTRSFSPAPMTPQRSFGCPAPGTPNFARSPTVPACFAVDMATLLGDDHQPPTQPQKRTSQAPLPPKSWGAATKASQACAPRSPGGPRAPRSPGGPGGRRNASSASSLFGSNLDDLLPSEDQLRLKGNVPRECFDRAQKRRQSASRDLRSQVEGFSSPVRQCAPSTPPQRPLASPTRNRSRKSVSSAPEPFESSPSRRKTARTDMCSPPRSLNRQPSWAPPPAQGLVVPNVKAALNEAGVETSKCTEIELEALWERFKEVRSEPLPVLQHRCRQQNPAAGPTAFSTLDKCAAFLVNDKPAATRVSVGSEFASSPAPVQQADRVGDAMMGAGRILSVRPARYANKVEWGFAVLDKPCRDLVSVQKAYRALMRPLHPDRVGSQADVVRAVELLREAKDLCERALRQQNPPDRPTRLTSTHICTEPGRRRFKVQWKAPESRENAPVDRYIVAVFDPSYGRALAVGTLEPDYHQELQRYLAHDDPELCSYVVSEEDLRKMPNLFKSDSITVQVSAGNNEGQSDWSVIKVRLQERRGGTAAPPVARPQRPSTGGVSRPTSDAPPARRTSLPGPGRVSLGAQSSAGHLEEDRAFDVLVEGKKGRELQTWLQQQKKEKMQAWLKKRFQQISGSKDAIIDRLVAYKEDNPW